MLFRTYSSSIIKFELVQETTLGVLIEEVHSVHIEADGDLFTCAGGGSGRNASGELALFTNVEVEVNFCTHKLGNVNVTLDGSAFALSDGELVIVDTFGTETCNNFFARRTRNRQRSIQGHKR